MACQSAPSSSRTQMVLPDAPLPPSMQRDAVASEDNRVLIIFYDAGVGKQALLKGVAQYGAEIVYQYDNLNGIAVRIPTRQNMADAMAYFEKIQGVLSVQRDQKMQLHR